MIARRPWHLAGGFVVLACVVGAAAQGAAGTTTGKPVIGKPLTGSARPIPGKRFTVSFKVTDSFTKAPVSRGTMVCAPSIAGKVVAHQQSFRKGIARVSFVVPASAAGKVIKLTLTIKAATGSTTKAFAFRVAPAIAKSGAPSGHYAGTTSQGKPFSFDFDHNSMLVSNLTATVDLTCDNGASVTQPVPELKSARVQGDLSFGVERKESQPAVVVVTLRGTLTESGSANGTLVYDTTAAVEPFGTHCATGSLTWAATTGGR